MQGSANSSLAVCFQRAEPFDVIRADDGRKIAGAAQKRNRHGLLFQGSVGRPAAQEVKDWKGLAEIFAQRLGKIIGAEPKEYQDEPWPAAMREKTAAQFAAMEWNERR